MQDKMQKIINRAEQQIELLEAKKMQTNDEIEKRILTEQISAFYFMIMIINQES